MRRNKENVVCQGYEGWNSHSPWLFSDRILHWNCGEECRIYAVSVVLISFTNNASAGEFAGITLVAAGAGYLEVAIMELITNAEISVDVLCTESETFAGDFHDSPTADQL